MLLSIMRMPKRARQVLSGIGCLMLSGVASPAQEHKARTHVRTPGEVAVFVAPAQTVVKTVHYQAQTPLVCDSVVCAGAFDAPGPKSRRNIRRITCAITGTPAIPFRYGAVELRGADGSHVLFQYLPPGHSSASGVHSINHAVDVQVGARQRFGVELVLAGGKAVSGSCNASGTLDRLQ